MSAPAADDHGADKGAADKSSAHCPSDEVLLEFIPGRLSGDLASSIDAHLRTCPICQSRITTLKHKLSGTPAAGGAVVVDSLDSPLGRAAVDSSAAAGVAQTLAGPTHRPPARLGEYELVRPIGRGGMGVVYKAVHTRLRRNVAIKMLSHLAMGDSDAAVRLQREVVAAGRVKHPNLVYALDAGHAEGLDYLVMEYVEGVDLGKLVAILDPLPIADCCEMIRQAALGLAHIDACGLVHRDLKPSNLMLTEDGTVKILDLGLARLERSPWDDEEAPTQAGYLLGTADFVSPEQVTDPHAADVRSDMYSLGCTFFKLLAGHAPFGGGQQNTVTSKLYAHRHLDPPRIRHLRTEVPQAVAGLIDQLLEKDPHQRLARPQTLADALAPYCEGAKPAALVRRAYERGDLEGIPVPNPSRTPPPADASTQPPGRTPTPLGLAIASRKTAWRWLAGVAAVFAAVAVAVAAAVGLPGRNGTRVPAPPVQPPIQPLVGTGGNSAPGSGTGQIDLAGTLEEIRWEGYLSSPPPRYDRDLRMLELRSNSYQLIKLGDYDGQPATIDVTIRQSPWHGDAGLFFGYRIAPHPGQPTVATFQLIHLKHFDGNQPALQLGRQPTFIGVNPTQHRTVGGRILNVDYPQTTDLRLRVRFGKSICELITLDGRPIPELTVGKVNGAFAADDYRGPWGLYSAQTTTHHDPTWFGNLEFAPVEN